MDKPHSKTKHHVNIRISLALIRGMSRCMTGTKTKFNGQTFELKDGGRYELLIY